MNIKQADQPLGERSAEAAGTLKDLTLSSPHVGAIKNQAADPLSRDLHAWLTGSAAMLPMAEYPDLCGDIPLDAARIPSLVLSRAAPAVLQVVNEIPVS